MLPEWPCNPAADRHPRNAPLHAWIDDTRTTVTGPSNLDAIVDRVPRSGVTLISDDGVRTLFISLDGDRSGLMWEDADEIMLS